MFTRPYIISETSNIKRPLFTLTTLWVIFEFCPKLTTEPLFTFNTPEVPEIPVFKVLVLPVNVRVPALFIPLTEPIESISILLR